MCGERCKRGAVAGIGPYAYAGNRAYSACCAGLTAGVLAGIVNGFIVTVLKVNPIIATLGTLAAFDGLAFLLAPDGKPIGIVTHPDFTWLGTGRFLQDLPLPALGGREWPGIPIMFVVFVVVAAIMHVVMRYTDFGRSVYAVGGNRRRHGSPGSTSGGSSS